jgi:hypothetical protein
MKTKTRFWLKTFGRVLLFLALLVLPTVARAGYYYRRFYVPRTVPRPDLAAVDVPTVAPVAFADVDVQRGEGRVVIDRAHENTVTDSDLSVLLARLTGRGLENISLTPGDHLPDTLRSAAALVIVAPHQPFSTEEIEAVTRLVEQGGRVLLVTDPSRYSFRVEYDDYYGETITLSSDVAAINGLAARFGLAFTDDYIYNTAEHAGNYQYVILKDFATSPLTAGLDRVVFYAAHSIAAGEQTLITADERTTSSLSEQTGGLATMRLGGGGRVLAVSDFTFMTEPYNGSADNNRLIANIADFLAGAERTYSLTDFPHFFGDDVDLVLLMGEPGQAAFSAEMIDQGSILQSTFESAGKTLHLQAQPGAGRDTIFAGLYSGVAFSPEASEILTSRGFTFTLETVERERATPTPTPRYTPTPTPTPHASPTPAPTERPLRDWIDVAGVGQVDAREIALIYQNEEAERQVVMVLAFTGEGLGAAVQRLILGDLTGCLLDQDRVGDPALVSLALCPTDYEPPEEGPTPTPTSMPTPEDDFYATPTPTFAAEGSILVVADDNGTSVYEGWTGAYDFQDIAIEAGYQATVWSTFWDGEVTLEQMQSYDAVIWCTGDYQEEESTPALEDLLKLAFYLADGGRMILAGAFIGSATESESGLLLDIQVTQPDHPLAEGFEAEQIITLERFTADEDYSPYVLDETDPDAIVFARGPTSELAGQAVITVNEDELSGSRTIFIGFPLYLVPWDERDHLGDNVVRWLMEGVEG